MSFVKVKFLPNFVSKILWFAQSKGFEALFSLSARERRWRWHGPRHGQLWHTHAECPWQNVGEYFQATQREANGEEGEESSARGLEPFQASCIGFVHHLSKGATQR